MAHDGCGEVRLAWVHELWKNSSGGVLARTLLLEIEV